MGLVPPDTMYSYCNIVDYISYGVPSIIYNIQDVEAN